MSTRRRSSRHATSHIWLSARRTGIRPRWSRAEIIWRTFPRMGARAMDTPIQPPALSPAKGRKKVLFNITFSSPLRFAAFQ